MAGKGRGGKGIGSSAGDGRDIEVHKTQENHQVVV